MSDDGNAIVRPAPTCPVCKRDLEMRAEMRLNGKVTVALVCARHGSFPNGWRQSMLNTGRAMQWAARQRQLQQARSRR